MKVGDTRGILSFPKDKFTYALEEHGKEAELTVALVISPQDSETLYCGLCSFGTTGSFPDETVAYDEMMFVLEGLLTLTDVDRSQTYVAKPRDCLLVKRGTKFIYHGEKGTKVLTADYPCNWREMSPEEIEACFWKGRRTAFQVYPDGTWRVDEECVEDRGRGGILSFPEGKRTLRIFDPGAESKFVIRDIILPQHSQTFCAQHCVFEGIGPAYEPVSFDEWMYCLEGELTMVDLEKNSEHVAEPGDCLLVTRGTRCQYMAKRGTTAIVTVACPAHFRQMSPEELEICFWKGKRTVFRIRAGAWLAE